jgi:hypothetical protein
LAEHLLLVLAVDVAVLGFRCGEEYADLLLFMGGVVLLRLVFGSECGLIKGEL